MTGYQKDNPAMVRGRPGGAEAGAQQHRTREPSRHFTATRCGSVPLAHAPQLRHNHTVRETSRAWFSSRNLQAGRTAIIGGIFSSRAIAPSMGGMVGHLRMRRVPVAGLLTRHCRPPRLAAGSGQPLLQEARTMATSARARSRIPYPHSAYHAAVAAGIASARSWFAGKPPRYSLGEYLDEERYAYCDLVIGIHEPGRIPLAAGLEGFADGFNRGLEQIIAGGASHD